VGPLSALPPSRPEEEIPMTDRTAPSDPPDAAPEELERARIELSAVPSLGRSYLRALAGGFTRKAGPAKRLSVTLPPRAVDVAHLERYRRVTGFSDPGAVPPTYPHVLAVPLHLALITHPAFPARALGLVHTEQRIDVLADLDPRRPLALTASVGGPRPARRGATFQLETTATADGEVVWQGLTTFLAPGHRPASQTSPDAAHGPTGDTAEAPPSTTSPGPGSDPAAPGEPGDVVVSLLWPLPSGLGRRYARVGGDYNPIHLSALTARLFGFKRAIAHGMWSMARVLAAVEDLAPQGPRRYTARFRRPLFLPSEVRFTATRVPGGLDLALRSARTGKPHLQGTVRGR